MRVRFKQFKDCKDHNIKVECTKLSLLPVLGRAHQKKETITILKKRITSRSTNCQKPLLFHSQWNVNLFNNNKKKRAEF